MNEAMDPDQPPRQISRWIAYPLLVVCPLAIILVGLKLGGLGYGERFMIASIESTPAENWVLSMLAICI